jgi:sugar-specific transcriptional regulator TrmB
MNLESVLQNSGLTEKQARIYLACLELGPSTVQKISTKANISRSTAYEVLDSLIKKGLVNTYLKKKVSHFNAIDPEEYINQSQEKIEILSQALPNFNALFQKPKEKPSVRLYEGKEGMKIVFKEILKESRELICFGSSDDFINKLKDLHKYFLENRLKKKIPLRLILTNSAKAKERMELGIKELRLVKILPEDFEYHGLVYVWKDKIALFSLANDFIALVIESKELSRMQKTFFEYIWKTLPIK